MQGILREKIKKVNMRKRKIYLQLYFALIEIGE